MTVRILVVDDDAQLRAAFARILERAGYEIATATNGRDALRRVRASRFDVVVSDFEMPLLDGKALLDALDQQLPLLARHVIIVTGSPGLAMATFRPDVGCASHPDHAARISSDGCVRAS